MHFQVAAGTLVVLPKTPMRRSLEKSDVKPGPVAALWMATAGHGFLIGSLLLAGCSSVPATTPAPPQEAMLPTLKLNDDLFKSLKPSNNRDWTPEQAMLAQAEFRGGQVTVRNVRDCRWRTLDDFDVSYFDRTFDLDKLTSVDFIVVPFNEMPSLGHTMLSFGFDDGDYLAVSVEIRKERGEAFSAVKGFFRQYELMYVVASERDVIQRRVNCDLCDVYLYRSTATPKQSRELFVDVMRRVNKLVQGAGVLRHADEQLHDEHPQPHQSSEAGRGSLRLPGAAARLFRSSGLRPGADRAPRVVRGDAAAGEGELPGVSAPRRSGVFAGDPAITRLPASP